MPKRILIPSSCAGPLKAADWPKRMPSGVMPASAGAAAGLTVVSWSAVGVREWGRLPGGGARQGGDDQRGYGNTAGETGGSGVLAGRGEGHSSGSCAPFSH